MVTPAIAARVAPVTLDTGSMVIRQGTRRSRGMVNEPTQNLPANIENGS